MVYEESWFACDDGARLFLRRWQAAGDKGKAKAALLVLHGMAEHGGRYARMAERLSAAGIAVWATDQRGHGKTANPAVNGPGQGGLLGHACDRDTFDRVSADMGGLAGVMRQAFPGLPLFLLGHSWGSFIAQRCIETWGSEPGSIDGCILSGSRGPGGLKIAAGAPVLALLAFIVGARRGTLIARALADGPYNRPFRPNRTGADWLSRDEAEVDAYLADSCSGMLCSAGFYRDLAAGLRLIHQEKEMARIRQDLPVYVFSGSADPVGEMGDSPTALVKAYRNLGIADLEFVLYPGARHEPLNETNREEVTENLLSWIQRHAEKKLPGLSAEAPPRAAKEQSSEMPSTETEDTADTAAGGASA